MTVADDITADRIISYLRHEAERPLSLGELATAFSARGERRQLLKTLLSQLEADGRIVLTRAQRYGLPERMNLVVGRLQGNRRGFGFVIPDQDDMADLLVPAGALNGAVNNDRVIARITGRARDGRRAEGEVIRILERGNREVVGVLELRKSFAFVTPADPRLPFDVLIPLKMLAAAADGDVVTVEITDWAERPRSPTGRIVRVLGQEGEPGVDVETIMFQYGLARDFPDDVRREAAAVPTAVRPEDLDGRTDLRDRLIITIDGADAKDLDDAISLEPSPHRHAKWRLGVHIADVSYYVREGTALDREAAERGTSVYLVDRVVPMLPPELSNGICSLLPGVDRLAMTVFMDIDDDGRLVDYELLRSVIRSRARLTYDVVRELIAGHDAALRQRHQDLLPMLESMHELAQLLFQRRVDRGAIDFDLPEAQVKLDEQGVPVAINTRRRDAATQMIEEFMIFTNETIARHHRYLEVPFLYRIHEQPTESAIAEFEQLISLFGVRLRARGTAVRPVHFQKVLAQVAGKDEQYLVSSVMLRSMDRARYSTDNLGHFGLAADHYTHFTAPIRRYPDLMIHRITCELLAAGKVSGGRLETLGKRLPLLAVHCSRMERLAEEAERDTVDLKKVQFMQRHIGDVFDAIISGVTNFGLFVQLPNTVEGLVHVSTLTDDYYHFEESRYALLGERSGRRFQLGDSLKVQLVRVNVSERSLDFELVPDDTGGTEQLKSTRRNEKLRKGAKRL